MWDKAASWAGERFTEDFGYPHLRFIGYYPRLEQLQCNGIFAHDTTALPSWRVQFFVVTTLLGSWIQGGRFLWNCKNDILLLSGTLPRVLSCRESCYWLHYHCFRRQGGIQGNHGDKTSTESTGYLSNSLEFYIYFSILVVHRDIPIQWGVVGIIPVDQCLNILVGLLPIEVHASMMSAEGGHLCSQVRL